MLPPRTGSLSRSSDLIFSTARARACARAPKELASIRRTAAKAARTFKERRMSSESSPVRWGIIGPGAIAQDFQRGVKASRTGKIVAIGARDPKREGLAENFPGVRL